MAYANPGVHHLQLGEAVVTALNDGQFEGETPWVVGLPGDAAETLLRDSFRPLPLRITVSCFLLRIGGRLVLVDAGGGGAMGHLLGHAPERLAALGIAPEAIDTVLVTHCHVDHVNGLLDASGAALYPRAELFISAGETGFWLDPDVQARAPEGAQMYFGMAQRALAPYRGRMQVVGDAAEVLPGITSVLLPGHTPGHTGWRIESGGESLLIWGDIVHLPGIQFARPEAGMAFDSDADQARATRAKALDMVASERILLAGMHLDFPTFGHVRRAGQAYAFEPLVWSPTESGPFTP